MNQEKLNAVQEILNEMVETSYVAGVNCLILEKGKEVGYYQAGYADLANKKLVKRDSIFRLYSMSKPVTAAAAMILIENGKIDLLDRVEQFIPSFKDQRVVTSAGLIPCQNPVTIKDLLFMTSGILYGNDVDATGIQMDTLWEDVKGKLLSNQAYTTLDIARQIGKIPLAFQPGTHWAYGASADVLGAVIEVVSGKTLGNFLKENIFNPLGMEDTGFEVPEVKRNRLTKVYQIGAEGLEEYWGNHLGILTSLEKKPSFESGGAGLVSTIDDYSRFATMLLNQGELDGIRILAPKTVAYMTKSKLPDVLDKEVAAWESLKGYSYGNLMRIMNRPDLAVLNGSEGEYGWDGWLGPYFANDPVNQVTFLMMQQKTETGTTTYTRKLRNVVAASL